MASKTRNLLELRAWKVALPNHMLLRTKLCCHKLGSNLQSLCGTGSVAIDVFVFFSPKEFSSITKSLIQYVNKISY